MIFVPRIRFKTEDTVSTILLFVFNATVLGMGCNFQNGFDSNHGFALAFLINRIVLMLMHLKIGQIKRARPFAILHVKFYIGACVCLLASLFTAGGKSGSSEGASSSGSNWGFLEGSDENATQYD